MTLLEHFKRISTYGPPHRSRVHKDLRDYQILLREDGIDVERQWKDLTPVDPRWRADVVNGSPRTGLVASQKVLDALASGELRPTVFSDVDHAIIDRDAQYDVDKKIMDLSTLEILGFVAHHFHELQNRDFHLDEIKRKNKSEGKNNTAKGQELFKWALDVIVERNMHLVGRDHKDAFLGIASKEASELTNQDFNYALGAVNDALYQLVIDPLSYDLAQTTDQDFSAVDAQSGMNRMKLIYIMQSAISHVAPEQDTVFRQEDFFLFNLSSHIYPGVEDFFSEARLAGCDIVSVTRGNQLPYMKEFGHGLSTLFDRVYSTLLWSDRDTEKKSNGKETKGKETKIFFPRKKMRPYSTQVEHVDSSDKLRIAVHETLSQFRDAGLTFSSDKELASAVATYMDHCIFITDTDIEMWGTLPIIQVEAIRHPQQSDLERVFGDDPPQPIAKIDPKHLRIDHDDHDIAIVDSFDPTNFVMGTILDNLRNRLPQTHIGPQLTRER